MLQITHLIINNEFIVIFHNIKDFYKLTSLLFSNKFASNHRIANKFTLHYEVFLIILSV